MAKFKKGETPPGAVPFSEETAKEMQARSAQARRTNRTLREVLREALDEEAAPGMTRLEALARKALANHYNGKLTMKDLKDLSAVLGEQTINVKTDTPYILMPKDDEQARLLQNLITKPAADGE